MAKNNPSYFTKEWHLINSEYFTKLCMIVTSEEKQKNMKDTKFLRRTKQNYKTA